MNQRMVFTEETRPGQCLKLFVSGDVDDELLAALENFIGRQRKRLKAAQDRDRYALPEMKP